MKPDRATADSGAVPEEAECVVCPLSLLGCGDVGRVVRLGGSMRERRRLLALGVRPGVPCRVLGRAPGGSPIHLRAGSVHLMLRRPEATGVLVRTAPSPEVDGDVPEV